MKALYRMTEAELKRAELKAKIAENKAADCIIAAGHGNVPWATLCRWAEQPNAEQCVVEYVAARKLVDGFYDERHNRMASHGSLRRAKA